MHLRNQACHRQNGSGPVGKPEEIGHLVTFLLSGDAAFINAAVIPTGGGQSYKY